MRITYFNARLREGGDHALILLISERVKFQSTPPRRRRLMSVAGKSGITFFNPRLREGGDNLKTGMWHCFTIFNPRLREGGDKF